MKVAVYFNLHKHLFSIVCLEKGHPMKGRVIKHSDEVDLVNVTFKVSEAGRQRVLREKRKNVHAYVIGELKEFDEIKDSFYNTMRKFRKVMYNPYKYSTFVDSAEKPVFEAEYVCMLAYKKKAKIFINEMVS